MKNHELDSSKCKTSAFSEDHIKRMKRHARDWEKIFVVTYLKKENYIEPRKNSQNQQQKKKEKTPISPIRKWAKGTVRHSTKEMKDRWQISC